jgi:hypothetical protein
MVVADGFGCRKARARTGALVSAFSTPDLASRRFSPEIALERQKEQACEGRTQGADHGG